MFRLAFDIGTSTLRINEKKKPHKK